MSGILSTLSAVATAQAGLKVVNVKSSSVENNNLEAENALDNDMLSRWSSAFKDQQWLQFELEKPVKLKSMQIFWEDAFAKEFEILVAENAGAWSSGNWKKVYSTNSAVKPEKQVISFTKEIEAQYIKINCLKRATKFGFSILEIKLNGQELLSPKAVKMQELVANTDTSVCGNPDLAPTVRAQAVVDQMVLNEKKRFVSGYNSFFIAPMKRFNLRAIYMTDASAGMHIRPNLFKMDKSISYPSTVALTATWEPELAKRYGASIAAECRGWGADVLLGPGVNLYRNSECGRNFEYMGEDPLLAGKMATAHIKGVQSNKIMATGKHFILNNHEWARFNSDIYVDDRTKREIYARPWYRMIHEGELGAIMSSYNLVDGEKASQSNKLLNDFLRKEIGFDRLIMSDWGAVWDGKKAVMSGQDLIMPRGHAAPTPGREGEFEANLDKMCKRILTECFRFGLYDRESKDEKFLEDYPKYEAISLETARKAVTLLKNSKKVLPLSKGPKEIIITGPAAMRTPHGGAGSGHVDGYNHTHIAPELQKILGSDVVKYVNNPEKAELEKADAVIVCVKTNDHEGRDRPFGLDSSQENLVKRVVENQPNSIVVIVSGGAIDMRGWNDQAAAILHGYYNGQDGGRAMAEVLAGKVNPSGKLPFSMEKNYEDSPSFGERPAGKNRSQGGKGTYPVKYDEGIFMGYRWYDQQKKEVLYPFGHGLSYTKYKYSGLEVEAGKNSLNISVTVKNTGKLSGDEIVQFYFSDLQASVARPEKELCGFAKVTLKAGENKKVKIKVPYEDLSFYDVKNRKWKTEKGMIKISAGASSKDLRLSKKVMIANDHFYKMPVRK